MSKHDLSKFSHVDLLYPSKYLKAADLRGKRVPVVIDDIEPRGELRGKNGKAEYKPVVSLRGKEKLFVMNVTNARAIAKVYGPEVTQWIGKTIVLYGTTVQAGGEERECIRVDSAATMKYLTGKPNGKAADIEHDEETGEVREPGSDDGAEAVTQ